ncbi:MAG: sugar ABC transporter permease, partial [Bacteroidetes bacterium]|nr:sugar ABC transporter permease [Bacteroidota bacterium]
MKKRNKLHSNTLGYIFIIPTMIIILVFIGYPMFRGVNDSFKDIELTSGREQTYIGLDNYKSLIKDEVFYIAIKNSFIFVITSVVFHLVLGFALALALDRKMFGRLFFR